MPKESKQQPTAIFRKSHETHHVQKETKKAVVLTTESEIPRLRAVSMYKCLPRILT